MPARSRRPLGLLLLLAAGCAGPAAVSRPLDSSLPAGAASTTVPVVPPGLAKKPPACHLGEPHAEARPVALADVLRDPTPYLGGHIRVRGLSVFAVETSRLVEPTVRREAMALDPAGLPPGSDVAPCHLTVVDVEGHLARTRAHGREGWVLVAESMATPARAAGPGAPLPGAGAAAGPVTPP